VLQARCTLRLTPATHQFRRGNSATAACLSYLWRTVQESPGNYRGFLQSKSWRRRSR